MLTPVNWFTGVSIFHVNSFLPSLKPSRRGVGGL